jgi:hypothetical protein
MLYQDLNQQFENYLVRKTKHAVILTGGWGIGKTHYIETEFKELAKRHQFTAIHISLFGVSSIDQIKDQIFLQLFPFFNNKIIKGSASVLKAVIKTVDVTKLLSPVSVSKGVDALDALGKEASKYKFDLSKIKKMVISFDDLERAHPDKLTANEILGFINSLVEDELKVVIIANESELFNKEKYDEIKEKTINQTIHFKQDFASAFAAIISYEPHHKDYVAFLNKHADLIQTTLTDSDQVNLRTLAYFIGFFGDIFSFVQLKLTIADLEPHKVELLERLMQFSLLCVCEFKKGHITYSNDRDLKDGLNVSMIDYLLDKNKERATTYAEETIKKYYKADNYHFYPSIFNYLTGGDPLKGEALRSEIFAQYHVVSDEISPAYKVLNQLADRRSVELPNAEYKQLTCQLRDFALQGEFNIEQLTSIFYYIVRNGNVLGLNPDRLSGRLINVVKRKKQQHIYNPIITQYLSSAKDSEFSAQLLPLAEAIIKINDEAFEKNNREIARSIERELTTDISGVFNRLFKDNNNAFNQVSLGRVRPSIFFNAFKQASNKEKQIMLYMLYVVYDKKYFAPASMEHIFLIELEKLLQHFLSKPVNKKSNSGELAAGMLRFISEKAAIN